MRLTIFSVSPFAVLRAYWRVSGKKSPEKGVSPVETIFPGMARGFAFGVARKRVAHMN
jgi:hypothetical protein